MAAPIPPSPGSSSNSFQILVTTLQQIVTAANALTTKLGQMLRNIYPNSLLGNATGSDGKLQSITLGATLGFSGTGLQTGAGTGDVTWPANSFVTTISNNAVTFAKFQQIGADTIVGNNTGSTANAAALTVSQVQIMLGLSGAIANDTFLGNNSGTTASAVALPFSVFVVPWAITGGLPSSMTGTNTSATMSISTFVGADSTFATNFTATGVSWAITNGNAINGYQGGTTFPSSATTPIHMFACTGNTGSGFFASTSVSSPTFPSGYNSFGRRVFSFMLTGAGAPIPFVVDETDGGGIFAYLTTVTLDINGATLSTGSRSNYTMNVPTGIKVEWLGIISLFYSSGVGGLWVTSPDEPDTVVGTSLTAPLWDINVISATSGIYSVPKNTRRVITNTSGQIAARGANPTTIYGYTSGWVDPRRS